MADFNEVEDVVGGMVAYSITSSLIRKYGLLNVLFFGALIAVTVMLLIFYTFRFLFNSGYDDTWDKVTPGVNLYAREDLVKDTITDEVTLYRLIRPISKADIDKMKIPAWKKEKLKMRLDTSLKNWILMDSPIFDADNARKYRTGFLGTYVKKDSVIEYGGFGQHWYAIKPNFKLIKKHKHTFDMPAGYVLADDYHYINAKDAVFQEIDIYKAKQ